MPDKGFFISFEGGEGSGKTTQINRLAESLTSSGHRVVTTREPGGTDEGESVRRLIVQRDGGDWTPIAETLLLFSARAMLVDRIIAPALERKKIIISDRFTDSTRVYQGYARGLAKEKIESLNKLVLDDLTPDLTFVLDLNPATGLSRSEHRLSNEDGDEQQAEDRFERMDLAFHEKLREGFLSLAKDNPKRCRVIDASKDIKTISDEILKIVNDVIGPDKKYNAKDV